MKIHLLGTITSDLLTFTRKSATATDVKGIVNFLTHSGVFYHNSFAHYDPRHDLVIPFLLLGRTMTRTYDPL